MTIEQKFHNIMGQTSDEQLLEIYRNDSTMKQFPIQFDMWMLDEMERRGITWYSPNHGEIVYRLGNTTYDAATNEAIA